MTDAVKSIKQTAKHEASGELGFMIQVLAAQQDFNGVDSPNLDTK